MHLSTCVIISFTIDVHIHGCVEFCFPPSPYLAPNLIPQPNQSSSEIPNQLSQLCSHLTLAYRDVQTKKANSKDTYKHIASPVPQQKSKRNQHYVMGIRFGCNDFPIFGRLHFHIDQTFSVATVVWRLLQMFLPS